jgi:hypothetical protein
MDAPPQRSFSGIARGIRRGTVLALKLLIRLAIVGAALTVLAFAVYGLVSLVRMFFGNSGH